MTTLTESHALIGMPARSRSLGLPQSPYFARKGFSMTHVLGGVGLWGAFSIAGLAIVMLASGTSGM